MGIDQGVPGIVCVMVYSFRGTKRNEYFSPKSTGRLARKNNTAG
jgi:hypothetical protein